MSSNNLKSRSTGGRKSEASEKSQLLDPVDSEDMRATTSKEDVNTGGDMDTGILRVSLFNFVNRIVNIELIPILCCMKILSGHNEEKMSSLHIVLYL